MARALPDGRRGWLVIPRDAEGHPRARPRGDRRQHHGAHDLGARQHLRVDGRLAQPPRAHLPRPREILRIELLDTIKEQTVAAFETARTQAERTDP